MEWLVENWFWVLIGVLFVGIHLFGHGGHGSHGRADSGQAGHDSRHKPDAGTPGSDKASGHRH